MGLDMYLTKKTYVGAEHDHRNVELTIDLKINGTKPPINPKRISYIEENVGYWRKANHIHNWFVTHCQEGEDDCREADVDKNDLLKLLSDCKAIKENKDKAPELMPTQSGFFFGGTDYDEYYFDAIDSTIQIIEALLAEGDPTKDYLDFDIYYQSSW